MKQQEVSSQLIRTMTEVKVIEEKQEGNALSAITDIKFLVSLKASRFPDWAVAVILLYKLHPKYVTDPKNFKRQLFLVDM